MDDIVLKKELAEHKVFSAWQFILNARKNIYIARYCKDIIESILSDMSFATVCWEQDVFSGLYKKADNDRAEINITNENLPKYSINLAGKEVDSFFLINKLIRDFYQYVRNTFDSIGQISNSGLLANKGKKIDKTDFCAMASRFNQTTYKKVFPLTAAWYNRVQSSNEFNYIDAINNRTKHTADIVNKISMGILGSPNTCSIQPFFRNEEQHDTHDLQAQLTASIDFLEQSFSDFMCAFEKEFILDCFIDGRINKIGGVIQQYIKGEENAQFSYAYIQSASEFSSMPDDLFILFVAERENDIYAHDCPFENILVCKNDYRDIVGRYIAVEPVGDDCLVRYRHYKKDNDTDGGRCRLYEMMKKEKRYFHNNMFFNVTSISDDDLFIIKSSLPF